MLDADDGAAVGADEVVEHAREVARARADVEDARTGAQIWEEELGGMCVLLTVVGFRSDGNNVNRGATGSRDWQGERSGETYHVWCRDGCIVADRSTVVCIKGRRTQGSV